jgi:hypothetical protein
MTGQQLQDAPGAVTDVEGIFEVTGIVEIRHKDDLSKWTRAHADVDGLPWEVVPGPGGVMVIIEYTRDRARGTRA